MGKQILIFLDKTLIFVSKIFFWVPPKIYLVMLFFSQNYGLVQLKSDVIITIFDKFDFTKNNFIWFREWG